MGPCCLGNIGSVLGGHVPAISVSTLLGVVALSSMEPTGLVQDSISMFFLYSSNVEFHMRLSHIKKDLLTSPTTNTLSHNRTKTCGPIAVS